MDIDYNTSFESVIKCIKMLELELLKKKIEAIWKCFMGHVSMCVCVPHKYKIYICSHIKCSFCTLHER